jgi:hypothetical protein
MDNVKRTHYQSGLQERALIPRFRNDPETKIDAKNYGRERKLVSVSELAGTHRGGQLQVRLETAANLNGGVACADDALAFAPDPNGWEHLAEEDVESFDGAVIEAHKAQSTVRRRQLRGQIVKTSESLEMSGSNPSIFDAGGSQHPVRDRLGCNSCQDSSPVVKSEL